MIRRPALTVAALGLTSLSLWACSDSSQTEPPFEQLQSVEQASTGKVIDEISSGINDTHSWRLTRHDDGCMVFTVDEQFAPGCMMLTGGGGQWNSGLSRDVWFIAGNVVKDTRTAPEIIPPAAGPPSTLRVVFADGSTRDTPVEADNVSPGVTAFGYVGPKDEELVGFFLLDADGRVAIGSPVYNPNTQPA